MAETAPGEHVVITGIADHGIAETGVAETRIAEHRIAEHACPSATATTPTIRNADYRHLALRPSLVTVLRAHHRLACKAGDILDSLFTSCLYTSHSTIRFHLVIV